jgi:hypothetical protein
MPTELSDIYICHLVVKGMSSKVLDILFWNVAVDWVALCFVFERFQFTSRLRDWVSWLSVFMVFSVTAEKCRGSILNLATTASLHILSNSLIINHAIIRRCIVLSLPASLNKLQTNKMIDFRSLHCCTVCCIQHPIFVTIVREYKYCCHVIKFEHCIYSRFIS